MKMTCFLFIYPHPYLEWASLVAQRLKHLPAMRGTWVRSLGQEDPLEKEMVTHPSILAWRIPWMEEPGGLQSTGSQRVGHDQYFLEHTWAATALGKSLLFRSQFLYLKNEGLEAFDHKCVMGGLPWWLRQ